MTDLLYLLDENALIDAKRDYYPIERVPEFWEWIAYQGRSGAVKVPREMYIGISGVKEDELALWVKGNKNDILLKEEVDPRLTRWVSDEGYGKNLSETEVTKIGNDPFLIAYALLNAFGRRVVTTESSKPTATRANRRIPDVCRNLGVRCINTFGLIEELDFKTGWRVTNLTPTPP